MKLSDWSEEKLIEYVKNQANTIGLGDDCAVIPKDDKNVFLVTTDALVQNIHFLQEHITPFQLGYKAIAVNASDIAAMGGTPMYAFLSISLPSTLDVTWVKKFFDGIDACCKLHNIKLMGGDTNGSKRDIFINVTLIGQAKKNLVKYRHSAKPGDLIAVTGNLGDSALGLELILRGEPNSPNKFINAHYQPKAYIQEGQWLAKQQHVHAMIDISDGLKKDLERVCKSSRCGAIVDIEKLPYSRGFDRNCDLTITGGEDYVLLCTITPENIEKIKTEYEKQFSPLHIIGKITEKENILFLKNDREYKISKKSFNHYAPDRQ